MDARGIPCQQGGHGASAAPCRKRPVVLPPASSSDNILIRVDPGGAGLFHYLLEGVGGHLALITVLDAKQCLLKLSFSPHQRGELMEFLDEARQTVAFDMLAWPFGGVPKQDSFNAGPGPGMEDGR